MNAVALLIIPYKKLIRLVMINNSMFNQFHTNLWTTVSLLRYLLIGESHGCTAEWINILTMYVHKGTIVS